MLRPCFGIEKKTVEHESDVYTNCELCSWYSHQRIETRTRGLGNKRTSRDHSNNCIIEKSLRDLRRVAVAQISVKDSQLTLM